MPCGVRKLDWPIARSWENWTRLSQNLNIDRDFKGTEAKFPLRMNLPMKEFTRGEIKVSPRRRIYED